MFGLNNTCLLLLFLSPLIFGCGGDDVPINPKDFECDQLGSDLLRFTVFTVEVTDDPEPGYNVTTTVRNFSSDDFVWLDNPSGSTFPRFVLVAGNRVTTHTFNELCGTVVAGSRVLVAGSNCVLSTFVASTGNSPDPSAFVACVGFSS